MNLTEIRAKYPQYADIPDRDLLNGLHKRFYSDMPRDQFYKQTGFNSRAASAAQVMADPISQAAMNPGADTPGGDQFLAGVGKTFTDLGHGAQQIAGVGPTRAEEGERRDRDVSLMATPAGNVGSIAGGVAATVPAVALGAGMLPVVGTGAAYGALQPVAEDESRLVNMALGAATAGGMKYGIDKGARALTGVVAKRQAQAAASRSQNAVADETLQAAKAEGLKVVPSSVRKSWLNTALEKVGGKAATKQEVQAANQARITAIARREASLGEREPIRGDTLEAARGRLAEPYREVERLAAGTPLERPPFKPMGATLKELQDTRLKMQDQWAHFDRSRDPAAKERAIALSQKAQALEDTIDAVANAANKPGLIDALRKARVGLAKNYDVGRAANVGSGQVEGRMFGTMVDRGKPLTGGLRTVGNFAEAFPEAVPRSAMMSEAGVSALEPYAGAGMALAGAAATGSPAGLVAGGLPLARGPARSLMMSGPYQSRMAQFTYPQATQQARLAALLRNPEIRGMLPAAGAMYAAGQ